MKLFSHVAISNIKVSVCVYECMCIFCVEEFANLRKPTCEIFQPGQIFFIRLNNNY